MYVDKAELFQIQLILQVLIASIKSLKKSQSSFEMFLSFLPKSLQTKSYAH